MCVCFFCVVMNDNHFCSLLEVTDRNRATTSVTGLLQDLEINRVVSVANINVVNDFILLSETLYTGNTQG